MTDIAPYDPTKIMDAVRDRIKAEFVALIPEDAWKGLVSAEVKKFFEPSRTQYAESPSDFNRLVWQLLEEDVKKRVKEYLDSPDWSTIWADMGKPLASTEIKKLLIENCGAVVTSVLGSAMQGALNQMRMHIQ